MPTLALTNSLSFRHMADSARDFPAVRVLGTIGWIAAGLIVGTMRHRADRAAHADRGGGLGGAWASTRSCCRTRRRSRPPRSSLRDVLGLDALKLMKERSFAVFVLGSFLVCIPLQFYYAFANPFFNELNVSNAAGKMTLGQMSEIFFMLVMPWFFRRLGVKYMLLVGMAAWVARYVLFAMGAEGPVIWMFYAGILLHGICYDFFFVTGQIYVDRKAPPDLRAAAQGFIAFVTLGVGMFIGSWLSGRIVDVYAVRTLSGDVVHEWDRIWMWPAGMAAAVLVLFALLFRADAEGPRGAARSRVAACLTFLALLFSSTAYAQGPPGRGGFVAYPPRTVDAAAAARGKTLYSLHCTFCHGSDAHGGDGGGPSLLRSIVVLDDQEGRADRTDRQERHGLDAEVVALRRADCRRRRISFTAFPISSRTPPSTINILVGDAKAGEAFVKGKCASCHAPDKLQGVCHAADR